MNLIQNEVSFRKRVLRLGDDLRGVILMAQCCGFILGSFKNRSRHIVRNSNCPLNLVTEEELSIVIQLFSLGIEKS
jgi:hypothetical protein